MRHHVPDRPGSASLLTLAFVLAAAGASAQESRSAPESRPAAESLVFAWPVPADVRVTERTLKKGKSGVMRYTASLLPHENGMDLLLSLRDFEFLEFGGLDLSDPAIKQALAPALAMTSAIPDLRIGKDGDLLGVVGIDRLAQRIVDLLSRTSGGEDKQKVAAMAQAFKNPRVLKGLEDSSGQSWLAWVGAWARIGSIERGAKVDFTTTTDAGPQDIHAEHQGPVAGKPGYVRLLLTTRTEGERAADLVRGVLQEMAAKMGAKEIPQIEACEVVSTCRAVTDPRTLMPLRVELEKRIRVKMGGKETSELEQHEYDFDWGAKDPASRKGK